MKETTDRRYPTGKFHYGKNYSLDETRKHIKSIARVPKDLKKLLKKLRDGSLDRSYRIGGWTARQVIHHLADSHLNAYIRFKLAATETAPIIKPYEENLWAEIEDAKHGSPKTSLKLLSALHTRWIDFLMSLSDDDLDRGYYHPSSKRTVSLREAIALYAWHGKHHIAHIKMVADGNIERASDNKKSIASKAKVTKGEKKSPDNKSLEAGDKPKKRVMSEAHKEKIRAAQQARRAAEKASKPGAATSSKRSKGTQIQSENPKAQAKRTADSPVKAKRGRPSKANLAATQAARPVAQKSAPEKAKRARRSSAEVAAEKAAKAAAPKLTRAEILAKARAAAAANRAAAGKPAASAGKAKPGRPSSGKAAIAKAPKPAAQKSAAEKGKRGRPSNAQVAVAKAAKPAAQKPAVEKGKPGRKPNPAVAAAKAAKAAAPKLSRAEVMEKARAAAAANRAAKAANAPKKEAAAKSTRVRRSSAEVAAEKAAKAAAPKLSRAEVMEKARAAAAANRAAKGQPAKPKKDPNAPKLTRAEALAKARAAKGKKQ